MQFGTLRARTWRHARSAPLAAVATLLLVTGAALGWTSFPALALSEIQREDLPPANPQADGVKPGVDVPSPDMDESAPPAADEPDDSIDGSPASPSVDEDEPPPEIIYNLDRLPEPVRRMHDLIVEAAKTGDVEKMRPLIGMGQQQTQLSLGGIDGDPITFLKGLSGDPEGQEILAVMEEVMNAGFVHLDAGTPQELYVWPYFFAVPLDKLDPRQRVELFKIVTAGDYEDMKQFGTYIFYRLGIDPQGRWAFFVAGD